jgi:membrane associated rhomboid family serine protease
MALNPRVRNMDGFTLSFPPIKNAVKWLLIVNIGIFLVLELAGLVAAGAPAVAKLLQWTINILVLTPKLVVHGFVWQVVTYAFIHLGVMSILTSSLGIWFIGSLVESIFGTRRFVRYYFVCVLGGALATLALAYSGATASGPDFALAGASAANYGLLLAVGLLMGETEFMMLPFPIQIKAKYLVAIVVVVAVLFALSGPNAIMSFGPLGGLVAGLVYIKMWGRGGSRRPASSYGGIGRGLSDRMYQAPVTRKESMGMRVQNAYARWKRRRMAKKFEVYMRKQNKIVHFDEHGNYRGDAPVDDKPPNGEGGPKPWVN